MRSIGTATTAAIAVLLGLGWAVAAEPGPVVSPMPTACVAAPATGQPAITFPHLARAMAARQRIVALTIGSSIVGGGSRNGDYYALVEQFLESTFKGLDLVIVQRGVSGELARDAARRIRLEVARNDPDVVFWQVGTADALAGLDPTDIGEVVRSTVRWLHDHRVDVVLIGLHYSPALRDDPGYQAVRGVIDDVARAEGVLRIRRYEAEETVDRLLRNRPATAPATESPTSWDDTCMAETLARALAAGLFARRAPGGPATP